MNQSTYALHSYHPCKQHNEYAHEVHGHAHWTLHIDRPIVQITSALHISQSTMCRCNPTMQKSDAHLSPMAASQKSQFVGLCSPKTGVVKRQVMLIFSRYSRPFSVLSLKCREGLLSHGFLILNN